MTDAEWVAKTLKAYEHQLVCYTLRLTGSADIAREIVQDAFLKLCAADRSAVESNVRAWLYTVCRNASRDHARKQRPSVSLSEDTQEPSVVRRNTTEPETPSRVVERNLQTVRVLALIDELSEDVQEVIRLKYVDDLSYQEIGELTGKTANHVGVLIHQGLRKIKSRLKEVREGSYGA
jgi:RNA polymerase sigma-70 factor (ECF subfamily)